MIDRWGREGSRERAEAARLIALFPRPSRRCSRRLLADPDLDVARQAIQTARAMVSDDPGDASIDALIEAMGRPRSTTMPPRPSPGSATSSFRSSRAG